MTLPIDPLENRDPEPLPELTSELNTKPALSNHPDFERYFLHFGIKALAGAVFASEVLTELEHGSGDLSALVSKYNIGSQPLKYSIAPVVYEFGLPEEALGISAKFWGSFAGNETERIPILSSDFISPLGYGMSGWAGNIPAEVFRKTWTMVDLCKVRQVAAILLVNKEVWGRCAIKLKHLELSSSGLSSRSIALVERANNIMRDVASGSIRQHSLNFGVKYLESLSPQPKIGESVVSINSGAVGLVTRGKESKEEWLARMKEEMVQQKQQEAPNPSNNDFESTSAVSEDMKSQENKHKFNTAPRDTSGINNNLKAQAEKKRQQTSQVPSRKRRLDPGALRDDSGMVVDNPAMFIDEDDSRYKSLLNSKSEAYELKRECVGVWQKGLLQGISQLHELESLKGTLESAYNQDWFAQVSMKDGSRCEGLVVYGARRGDFFTLINERSEKTIYPQLRDVVKIEFFKETICRKT